MVLWAHSRSDRSGVRHELGEHCRSTAEWASRFASVFGAGELAYALGLFHDAGKASCGWQQRLLEVEGTGNRVGLPHKQLGARLAFDAAGLAALAVLGHHGGLTNPQALQVVLTDPPTVDDHEAAARFCSAVPEAAGARLRRGLFPIRWSRVADKLAGEMRLRLVFSALVDADHLDTAAHRNGLAGPQVAPPADMGVLVERFERRRAEMIGESVSAISRLRSQVYDAAVVAAAGEPGLFRLAAPTGLGKTFAQAAFGLHHAARWGKSRVIVAVPFITITEQNADVYRRLLDTEDQPVVLEHHSSVRFDETDTEETTSGSDGVRDRWSRLAAENWDAPFVVTTTVQLFDSLFGRKPSQVRKLHRLANAVVILDEVQALPTRLLLPILSGLRTLAEDFGTTVLLTSATQPHFQALSVWQGSDTRERVRITEIIGDPQPLFDQARRVKYRWLLDPKPTWPQIAEEIGAQPQALVIVNSVADARTLYRLVSQHRDDVWHLSTRMCPQHRRAVLATVAERLRGGLPTVVVSTQLVEAGVDLSFPVVWRALAPADSLQQAAGRANRHGEHTLGGLVVFDPADGRRPAEYELACQLAVRHFGPDGPELDNQQTLARYYEELYTDLQLDQQRINTSNAPVGQIIQHHREGLDFHAVADGPLINTGTSRKRDPRKAFRMITDESVPLVVLDHDHPDHVQTILADLADLADLAAGTMNSRAALRQLQPWIVQLRTTTAERPDVAALIDNVIGDLGIWKGTYDWDPHTRRGVGLDEASIETIF
ncbi:CRISPR-associated helicase Cas3' [Nocardia nepalensis]|uniref:CRISPR-associated helicase Cas3' n=1 Tax=Nocardia nepalensis TaxID=3375448 RepID=UPI003B6751C0